ncbi:hypothetical protein M9H77_31651 [Catharanthus roseus]|uniref:Uncharacterized protein n=1 Tax=Catharanthus roseus TaxID=4058 RepID=A0ACC0A2S0_CATRO|nr:hypothetical protein M9H77_31651 [Catharanthus roseus]
MDDGEEVSDHIFLQNSDSSSNIQTSDSFLDDLLRNAQTCTHTHTCNPPGPDSAAHTHTCYHTHTQVIPSEEIDVQTEIIKTSTTSKPKKRNSGNREAVRKYREKKKAHTAYLEEEVKKLRFVNQQLIKKVQRQAVLESEILRLRGILFDFRSKIDGELGAFPFSKQCNSNTSLREGDCGIQMKIRCEDDLPCFHPQTNLMGGNCFPATVNCQINQDDAGINAETLVLSASQAE